MSGIRFAGEFKRDAAVFGGFFHSSRDTVADEFSAVAGARLDYQRVIAKQLQAYRTHHPQTLNAKPVWGGSCNLVEKKVRTTFAVTDCCSPSVRAPSAKP